MLDPICILLFHFLLVLLVLMKQIELPLQGNLILLQPVVAIIVGLSHNHIPFSLSGRMPWTVARDESISTCKNPVLCFLVSVAMLFIFSVPYKKKL